MFTIPYAGHAIRALREPVVLNALVYGAPAILVLGVLRSIWRRDPDPVSGGKGFVNLLQVTVSSGIDSATFTQGISEVRAHPLTVTQGGIGVVDPSAQRPSGSCCWTMPGPPRKTPAGPARRGR